MSQELGMNFILREEELNRVKMCREGQRCIDEDAANKVLGTINKKNLDKTQFLIKFERRNTLSSKGYWSHE